MDSFKITRGSLWRFIRQVSRTPDALKRVSTGGMFLRGELYLTVWVQHCQIPSFWLIPDLWMRLCLWENVSSPVSRHFSFWKNTAASCCSLFTLESCIHGGLKNLFGWRGYPVSAAVWTAPMGHSWLTTLSGFLYCSLSYCLFSDLLATCLPVIPAGFQ